jgi:HEAT repeat protein
MEEIDGPVEVMMMFSERCCCESKKWLLSLLVATALLGEPMATRADTVPQQATAAMARLAQGTNLDRQHNLLHLCVALDEGRRPPRIDHVVRAVIPLVQDDDPLTRSLAVEVLRRVGKEARPAIPALIRVLGDRDSCAGLLAVLALASLGEEAVQPLTGALKEEDVVVRQLAASALGRIGPRARAALPALKKARDAAQEDVVQERLDIAIKRISKRD